MTDNQYRVLIVIQGILLLIMFFLQLYIMLRG